jgi:maltooligosyltrehalose trehalohydrolase
LRWFGRADRLLVVNLGTELILPSIPEPLLASPTPAGWTILWSSEDAAYGGAGTAAIETHEGWRIPGQAAILLAPRDV